MIKQAEAQKQRPHELLWMLWFDGKSISKVHTTAEFYRILYCSLNNAAKWWESVWKCSNIWKKVQFIGRIDSDCKRVVEKKAITFAKMFHWDAPLKRKEKYIALFYHY